MGSKDKRSGENFNSFLLMDSQVISHLYAPPPIPLSGIDTHSRTIVPILRFEPHTMSRRHPKFTQLIAQELHPRAVTCAKILNSLSERRYHRLHRKTSSHGPRIHSRTLLDIRFIRHGSLQCLFPIPCKIKQCDYHIQDNVCYQGSPRETSQSKGALFPAEALTSIRAELLDNFPQRKA